MRKLLLIACATAAVMAPAQARDLSITLPNDAQQASRNLPAAFDQCIAGATLRGEMTTCKLVSTFIGALSTEVANAQAKADAEDKAKAEAEAEKKASEPKAKR